MIASVDRDRIDRAGRTWWKPLVGLLVSVSAAVACGILSLEYVKARTMNLRDQTTQFADAMEKLLAAEEIDPDGIERTLPEQRQDDRASCTSSGLPSGTSARLTLNASSASFAITSRL